MENGNQKKTLTIIAAGVLCLALIFVFGSKFLNSKEADTGSGEVQTDGEVTAESEEEAVVVGQEGMTISLSDISETASFYPIEVDGMEMEVIAVKDSGGNIRTAFNTCQICYSSGRGYYVQDGDFLVCQNCGNHFSMDQVGVEAGGCNPWPIFEEDRTETEESISISYEFLAESKEIFANWKSAY